MTEQSQELEAVVLKVVKSYVSRKLAAKYGLEWNTASKSEEGKRDWEERKTKVAKDAFLAVRARTGADFIEYFVSTLCSVPQHLPEETFITLSKQLYLDTDRVRTLTLLALSARG